MCSQHHALLTHIRGTRGLLRHLVGAVGGASGQVAVAALVGHLVVANLACLALEGTMIDVTHIPTYCQGCQHVSCKIDSWHAAQTSN